jgi:hypothetical protein
MPFNDSILLVDRKWNQMGKQPLKGMPHPIREVMKHSKTLATSGLAPKVSSLKVWIFLRVEL